MERVTYEQGWAAAATRNRGSARFWTVLRTRGYRILSDESLVRRARDKDNSAFDAFVARYRDRLYRMAFASLGNQRDADDALCELIVTAHDDILSAGAISAPRSWLYLHGVRAVVNRLAAPAGRHAFEHPVHAASGA